MNSKNTNFDVKTEAQFYAEKLQSRHLNQVASDACLYVPSKERINKVLFTTFLLANNKGHLLRSVYREHHSSKQDHIKKQRDIRNTRRRTERTVERIRQVKDVDSPGTHESSPHQFLEIVSKERVKRHYSDFYKATSREALLHHTCAVCGRSRTNREEKIHKIPLDELPNSHRLTPSQTQRGVIPAGELTKGLLLLAPACRNDTVSNKLFVNACDECLRDLNKSETTLPPRHSLANDLWTGAVPWELQVLTLPERLLISLNFTRVYVIKLQPKVGSSGYDSATLQSALVGNVIAYEHNMPRIAAMVNGDILPHKPEILASLISIALVSVGTLRKSWLCSTFQVRRNVVKRALQWLKANNPYYKDVCIDDTRVDSLPSSDVPEEITACIRRNDDPEAADRERAGYVPSGEDPLPSEGHDMVVDDDTRDNEAPDDTAIDPNVIPLQPLGVLDTNLADVGPDQLSLHGIMNLWKNGQEGMYLVQHGNAPVRDLPSPSTSEADPNTVQYNYWARSFPLLFPYGVGAPEASRRITISLKDHARWLLEQQDRRFRMHETFAFVVCNMQQKRDALFSSSLQVKLKDFRRDHDLIQSISTRELSQAAEEEKAGRPITSTRVKQFKKIIFATASRVLAADSTRFKYRQQLRSMCMSYGPPNVWITINPDDLHEKVLVTLNIQTDVDLVNGTRGEIVDIVLHPEEPEFDPSTDTVNLKRTPLYVLVKLSHTRLAQLPGLPPNVVPIQPSTRTFSFTPTHSKTAISVSRSQLPITGAYAFTDYRSQGQTIKHVIVDIMAPPSGGGLDIANLYVALSRSSGRETIRILRPFSRAPFKKPQDVWLLKEDERLEHLNEQTKKLYLMSK